MSERLCGNCERFEVLDDMPRRPELWFGVCWLELERDLDYWREVSETLDWVYDHGRHGDDDCDRPDEWFEGDDTDE